MPQKNEINKTVLVTVLDWGLGHATRTIPIIQSLEKTGVTLLIASSGSALTVLQRAFPSLPSYKLPGYAIQYPTSNMLWNIGYQMPKIIWVIIREFLIIQRIARSQNVDIIITDNRYGCFSWRRHSIFMTHQLYIKSGIKWLDPLLKWVHLSWIRFFDECWIPDFPDTPGLAGCLAHPKPNQRYHYIGLLSRFKPVKVKTEDFILVILSGPEPQRSRLEQKLLLTLAELSHPIVLIRGLPNTQDHSLPPYPNIKIIPYLSGKPLSILLQRAKFVICRSGYSSMMDLITLQKQAFLIPTPGQTEQIYLAQWATQNQWFFHQQQDELDIPFALTQVAQFQPPQPNHLATNDLLQSMINQLIKKE